MKRVHVLFLNIMKSALLKERLTHLEGMTSELWSELFQLAQIHKVLPMVVDAVCECDCLDESFRFVKRTAYLQVMTQIQKTSEYFELIHFLYDHGINVLTVKGIVCRNLYPNADLRISRDEDLLVRKDQVIKCHEAMIEFGMSTAVSCEEMNEFHEITYVKQDSPLRIELHQSLFPEGSDAFDSWNVLFEKGFDQCVQLEMKEGTVWTLCPDDHLMYLLAHGLKHFLHGGFGIRQLCDIVLYVNQYGSAIDWNLIEKQCHKIHAGTFVHALFVIGRKYLVLDNERACLPEKWCTDDVDEMELLDDLLESGIYGDSTRSRKHSANMTLKAFESHLEGKKVSVSMKSSLFPSKEKLSSRYPYVKKSPALLPVAWGHRIIRYGIELFQRKDSDAIEAVKIGHHRMELMKKYQIIDE